MAATLRTLGVAGAVLMIYAAPALSQTAEPIRYTLSFPAPQTHYVEVRASVPTGGQPAIELMMAVWTPGSYLVREFSRNVEAVTARTPDGQPLGVDKSTKNRWRVITRGAPRVTVSYRVYGREMSVRTNWVEAGFAMLNGAPTFLTLADSPPRPHEVTVEPAAGWARVISSLPAMPGVANAFRAPDYDTLVDSPIVAGNPAVRQFVVGGRTHYLVDEGEDGVFDGARAAKDLETIVREHERLWGSLPYDDYYFFNMITESGGGLEHKNSVMLMASRWATSTRRAYVAWLDLASHEHFHAWNVKRLRPVELGPFDYEHENPTRSLWMSEGFTDYYAALTVYRAGLATEAEYLNALSDQIESLQATPGRLVQSAAMASFDAWIKYYRPDENTANTGVSYYTKGAVIGFLLDAKIRRATSGAKSLDDVMRAEYARFAGERGFTPEQFLEVAEEVAGVPLRDFWDQAVTGTGELDYAEALDTFGLRFKPVPAGQPSKAYLGIRTRNDNGRLLVTQILRDTPAYGSGLNVDDEILAIDDFRVRADRLDNRLEQYQPGDTVSVLVARREQLVRVEVTFGSEPPKQWRLEEDPAAPDAAVARRTAWLHPVPPPA